VEIEKCSPLASNSLPINFATVMDLVTISFQLMFCYGSKKNTFIFVISLSLKVFMLKSN